jgi:hypothetical protein
MRARSTRLAGAVREHAIRVNSTKFSFEKANSIPAGEPP